MVHTRMRMHACLDLRHPIAPGWKQRGALLWRRGIRLLHQRRQGSLVRRICRAVAAVLAPQLGSCEQFEADYAGLRFCEESGVGGEQGERVLGVVLALPGDQQEVYAGRVSRGGSLSLSRKGTWLLGTCP